MRNRPIIIVFVLCALVSFTNCNQSLHDVLNTSTPQPGFFFEFRIREGKHSADFNSYMPIHTEDLKFSVRFDSTAIYQTIDPMNQSDINKLYGFADNGAHHHEYSARFGWNWGHGGLVLFAYVYNNGILETQELTAVTLNKEYNCSISVDNDKYVFKVDNLVMNMPRNSNTHAADGYKLYPYFGGDETAPHDIRIWIKEP